MSIHVCWPALTGGDGGGVIPDDFYVRFRSEHPRSALLRGTGHMRTLDQMARNRADENTRERGRWV